MSATLEQTPMCEATGLPLPILPHEPDSRAHDYEADFHHHFHPEKDPVLGDQVMGGRALRYARGQTVERFLHDRYHRLFAGPPLPEAVDERLKLCVLACAGVVPRQAIDLGRSGGYQVVDLSQAQFDFLTHPRSIHIEAAFKTKPVADHRRRTVGRFLAEYALERDLSDLVSKKDIKQFLSPRTPGSRKLEIGNSILIAASRAAIDDIIPLHRDLRREGYVAHHMPNRITKIVRRFFTADYYPHYYMQITRSLEAM